MTKSGRREFLRRVVVMLTFTAGLIILGTGSYLSGVVLMAASIAIYVYLPVIKVPERALAYGSGQSQTIPDWLGFIVSSLFFAFPVWAAISEPNWGTIHPSSVLLWPMAVITSSFWIIGALYASYWILIEKHKLVISSAFSRHDVRFDNIKKVRHYSRGLPKWLNLLAPLMIMKGQFSGAGSLLLMQKRTGMELVLNDGRSISIADSAYEQEIIKILQALGAHNVKLAAYYARRLEKLEGTKNE